MGKISGNQKHKHIHGQLCACKCLPLTYLLNIYNLSQSPLIDPLIWSYLCWNPYQIYTKSTKGKSMYTSTPPCCLIASVSLSLSASLHSLQFAVIPLSLSDSPVLNFPSVCSCHSNTRISPLASYHTRKKAIPYFMLFLSISSWSHYNKINNQSNSLNTIKYKK